MKEANKFQHNVDFNFIHEKKMECSKWFNSVFCLGYSRFLLQIVITFLENWGAWIGFTSGKLNYFGALRQRIETLIQTFQEKTSDFIFISPFLPHSLRIVLAWQLRMPFEKVFILSLSWQLMVCNAEKDGERELCNTHLGFFFSFSSPSFATVSKH